MTTTCQICGRDIKAKKGVIAHHGYRRPGDGWQTGSCFGARHVPYEQGSDAIEIMIPRVAAQIEHLRSGRDALEARPAIERPTRYDYTGREMVDVYQTTYISIRVERTEENKIVTHEMGDDYEVHLKGEISKFNGLIAREEEFKKYLEERLANWKPQAA